MLAMCIFLGRNEHFQPKYDPTELHCTCRKSLNNVLLLQSASNNKHQISNHAL